MVLPIVSDAVGIVGLVITAVEYCVQLCDEVQCNKQRAKILKQRLEGLRPIVRRVEANQQYPTSHQYPTDMRTLLNELRNAVQRAQALLEEWHETGRTRLKVIIRTIKVKKFKDSFEAVLTFLDDKVKSLSICVAVNSYEQLINNQRLTEAVKADTECIVGMLLESQNDSTLDSVLAELEYSREMLLHELRGLGCDNQEQLRKLSSGMDSLHMKVDQVHEAIMQAIAIQYHGPEAQLTHIRKSALNDMRPVGEGGFADIHWADYHGTAVAVKIAKHYNKEAKEELLREAYLMSQLHDPRVVRFFGIVHEMEDSLVMDFMQKGSLYNYLKQLKQCNVHRDKASECCCQCIDCSYERLQIAVDVASAVAFLHSGRSALGVVVHGDIKTKNLLVNSEHRVKLSDFGHSIIDGEAAPQRLSGSRVILSKPDFSVSEYSAPEQIESYSRSPGLNTSTTSTDVYALGAVLFEIFTCTTPYSDQAENLYQVLPKICEGARLTLEQLRAKSSQLADLIEKCTDRSPDQRPTAKQVADHLRDLLPCSAANLPPRCSSVGSSAGLLRLGQNQQSPSEGPPYHLQCPITHELLEDPVILVETGHTYERAAIEYWLNKLNHATDPCTNQQLKQIPASLVPNHAVRQAVQEYNGRLGNAGGSSGVPHRASSGLSTPPRSSSGLPPCMSCSSTPQSIRSRTRDDEYLGDDENAQLQEALRISVEEISISGKPPVPQFTTSPDHRLNSGSIHSSSRDVPNDDADAHMALVIRWSMETWDQEQEQAQQRQAALILNAMERRQLSEANTLLQSVMQGADLTYQDCDMPLVWAARVGYYAAVQLLITRNVVINDPGQYGNTPLHEAAVHGHGEVVKLLIANYANVNAVDQWRNTPLHRAALSGHVEVVKALLQAPNILVSPLDQDRNTPLHNAAFNGHAQVAVELLHHGAHKTAVNCHGYTPHLVAMSFRHSNVADILASCQLGVHPRP